jgi:TonB-dependent SusC/RagA subfamily outer membrane receptor
VTDAATQQPIAQAQVQIVGTTLGGLTGADGRAVVQGISPAVHQVRVLRVGYAEQKKQVTIVANEQATVDVALGAVAVSLAPVVTTATGEQRRVEIGNSVAQIDAAKVVNESPVRSVDDLINSRTAGVAVQTGTQTGTGSRVRIRGQNSLNLSNDPIYVIDGIRMTSDIGSNRYGTGGSNASRVGDINPEEIENIEVVKGPSAATLYGTDAANGVIVITTKRGRAGAARWNVYGEGGYLNDRNTYPWNYTLAGHSVGSTAYRECTLPTVSAGSCVFDSLRVYAPAHDPDATPIGSGNRWQAGAQVSAGTDVIRYFLSGEREEEVGTLELPDFERRRFKEQGIPLHDWTDRPNTLGKNSYRANVGAALGSKLDVTVSSGFINLKQRYTLESNATAGLGSHLFGGPGYKDNCNVAVTPPTPCNGYRAWTPGYTWQEKVEQGVNRFNPVRRRELPPVQLEPDAPDRRQRLHGSRGRRSSLSRRGSPTQRDVPTRLRW